MCATAPTSASAISILETQAVESRSDAAGYSTTEEDEKMNAIKIVAMALIVAGALGLLYGGFSYTKQTPEVKLGSLELSVDEKKTINVPVWLGVGAMAAGVLLLVVGSKKK